MDLQEEAEVPVFPTTAKEWRVFSDLAQRIEKGRACSLIDHPVVNRNGLEGDRDGEGINRIKFEMESKEQQRLAGMML